MFKSQQEEAKPLQETDDSQLMDLIDQQRHGLQSSTAMTKERFDAWLVARRT